jgi:hypothetical protein
MTNFILVLVCAVCVASIIGSLYAFGLRNLIKGEGAVAADGTHVDAHPARRIVAYVCFALCVLIVVFALILIVPQLHALVPWLK